MARKSAEEKAQEHGWVKAERPKIQKWAKNKIVEGIYVGMKDGVGEFKSSLITIVDEDGVKGVHSCPTSLKYYFDGIRLNVRVKIVCLGKVKAKKAGMSDPWDFEVYWHGETTNIEYDR